MILTIAFAVSTVLVVAAFIVIGSMAWHVDEKAPKFVSLFMSLGLCAFLAAFGYLLCMVVNR